ncbi:hypothetical protein HYH03_010993 [Edaphochlamys debaryana]|uniref:BACK domain-containing protein n=1 Tax=Edaphochlamys debaryana TaxID=47281 RepID=A0A836BVL9_9CHLO|nr:hypothetical protein HYH03_010993 [Edaphochlamys debaryana]|eukprot:KAG2490600.1 hypothetical protein HYH03_010993 [Edaphochlamys debaryana]
MSEAVRAWHSSLFGQEESADCVLKFVVDGGGSEPPPKRLRMEDGERSQAVSMGNPLPGHLLILRPGSSFLKSQAERWAGEQTAGAKLELRVPLEDAGDYPYALSAVRFIYTGELDVGDVAGLVRVRRLTAFLGVEGCPKAADAALVELARSRLSGVAELYACRQLLPDPDHDPAAAELRPRLRAACRERLVEETGSLAAGATFSVLGTTGGSVKEVKLGEVLAWAFPDAPSVLSDPAARKQLLALSAAALEALLSSEGFGTDVEDTVLLLLAYWLKANRATSQEAKQRLCKCILLSCLSDTYTFAILPLLSWFPISPPELRFLQQYRYASPGPYKSRLDEAARGVGYDITSPWYSDSPRPRGRADAGVAYEWSIPEQKLEAELAKLTAEDAAARHLQVNCIFANGASRLCAAGLQWYPGLSLHPGKDAAGCFLYNALPPALGINAADARTLVVAVCPGRCSCDGSLGPYLHLHDGRISGSLTWRDCEEEPGSVAGMAAATGEQ